MAINLKKLTDFKFTKDSWNWFTNALKMLTSPIFKRKEEQEKAGLIYASTMDIGSIYLFLYDAKHKDTLPYWDRTPMVIYMGPSQTRAGHFIGLNLHYLPPAARLKVLESLEKIHENNRFSDNTKLQASYEYLKGLSNFNTFKVCIKEYIGGRVVSGGPSKFLKVAPTSWERIIVAVPPDWRTQAGKNPPY